MSFVVRNEAPPDNTVIVVRGGLAAAGFELLATGDWPHYDIILADLSDDTIERLRDCFGLPFINPASGVRLGDP